jgi:hypothetical protein
MCGAFDKKKSAGDSHTVHYSRALPTRSGRDWNVNIEDVIRIVLFSDKNRCQVMCAVCPATGVAVPRWIRARQGRSLPFVDSMRTSTHLLQTGADTGASSASATDHHRCNMFDYIGSAVHHANSRAVRGIFFAGLRNDYSYEGGYSGRTANARTHTNKEGRAMCMSASTYPIGGNGTGSTRMQTSWSDCLPHPLVLSSSQMSIASSPRSLVQNAFAEY